MSREIKFRAWDNIKKEWTLNIMECVSSSTGNIWMEPALKSHKVVIEQYTGLKDKNGKEIYEGDIVEIDKYGKFQIIWNEWACKFDFDKIGKREREEPLLSQDWEEKSEVIGNIHENPELIGGEE